MKSHNVVPHSTGFTITELLVSIAIIGVLVAMILPAVQYSRESARRATCQNNLHQFGLAIHSFEERHRHFSWEGGPQIHPHSYGAGYSVQCQLLGDLDLSTIASRFDFRIGYSGLVTHDLDVPVFRCPSDPSSFRGISYRACEGAMTNEQPIRIPQRLLGMFAIPNPRTSDVTDGMSQTIVMSERIRSDEDLSTFTLPADLSGSGLLGFLPANRPLTAEEMLDTCAAIRGPGTGYCGRMGWYWERNSHDSTSYNHISTPNSMVMDCSIGTLANIVPGMGSSFEGGMVSARSYHSGGVNCLLGDGSSRYVSDSIDLNLWRSLATVSGQEVVGDF